VVFFGANPDKQFSTGSAFLIARVLIEFLPGLTAFISWFLKFKITTNKGQNTNAPIY